MTSAEASAMQAEAWTASVAQVWRDHWRGRDHRYGRDFAAFLGERFLTDMDLRHLDPRRSIAA